MDSRSGRESTAVDYVIIIACGVFFGLVFGVIRNGMQFLQLAGHHSLFIALCIGGSILYAVFRHKGMKTLVFMVFIVTLAHLLVFKVTDQVLFLAFFLYYVSLGATVYLYRTQIVPRLGWAKIGKFIVFAAILVVIYSVVQLVVNPFFKEISTAQAIYGVLTTQSFLGAGLGLGFEVAELLLGGGSKVAGIAAGK